MSNLLKKIRMNLKIIFCIGLIILAILMLIWIIIFKPQKNSKVYLYNTGYKSKNVIFANKIEQDIYPNVDTFNAFNIDIGSKTFKNIDFNIKVEDYEGKVYFDSDVSNYNSTLFYLYLGELNNMKNKILKLSITCKNTCAIKAKTSKSLNKKNHIKDYNNSSLNITVDSTSLNKNYYWYPIMMIAISILLMPFSRSEENEKK